MHESYDVVGMLKTELATKLRIESEVKIVAGAGDNAAAAVGTGTVGNGRCNISIGTSGTVFISNNSFGVDSNNSLHSFAHADGKYHLMGCILSAASCNKWWCEQILKNENYAEEQKKITELGKNKVFFLPYLMGERSPHNDANARGVFFGIDMNTSREEMTQAVLEGVAFALKDSFEVAEKLGVEIKKANICGGGAKSPLWKKIISNVLNIELVSVTSDEGPALGAAMLAAVGCGIFKSVNEAADSIVKYKETVKPDEDTVKLYNERYQKFKRLYPALKETFDNR